MSAPEDMFPGTFAPSPKISWLNWHHLETVEVSVGVWHCRKIRRNGYFRDIVGEGVIEDDAILDYCQNSGVSHWTVDGMAK
jgi:hypothetical protein